MLQQVICFPALLYPIFHWRLILYFICKIYHFMNIQDFYYLLAIMNRTIINICIQLLVYTQLCFFLKFYLFYFHMNVCVSACVAPCMDLVPLKARRSHWTPKNWSQEQLCHMQVLVKACFLCTNNKYSSITEPPLQLQFSLLLKVYVCSPL